MMTIPAVTREALVVDADVNERFEQSDTAPSSLPPPQIAVGVADANADAAGAEVELVA